MKKITKIIIARIMAVIMMVSILPLDLFGVVNVVMAQELGDNVESGSTIDNEAGDFDNDASIGNPESDRDDKDAESGEETPGNMDSSNEEGSDNKDSSNGEGSDNTDTSNGEDSGNADTSNGEGSDNTDNSDAENPDSTDGNAQDEEDSETTPNEEGLEEASVEESEEETVVKKASTVRASGFSNVGGWFESIYAEIDGVAASDVTEVSYTGTMTGKLSDEDLKYLVRVNESGGNNSVRIDIPGLKAGTYTLTVKVGVSTLTAPGITVSAYDRSGYAHFKYTEGVGAYNDDGTLKSNAIVLYVTDDNKNDVKLTLNKTTTTGIGNILNSSSSKHNSIIKKLTEANTPLVVRFIGTVSDSGLYERAPFDVKNIAEIDGLTAYASKDNGGSLDDNGHMASIQAGKNITLEGIGYDAVIDGWGFSYVSKSANDGKSFEVRNLTFINTPEDAVGMEGSQTKDTPPDLSASVERCWIHNNEFYRPQLINAVGSDGTGENDKNEGDGSVDFKRGQYLTCSYNYFERCHKTNLVGSGDTSLQFNLTYHHNHWYMCQSRGPLSRMANIHMYNNIVDMQTDYAQNTRANAYIFSEYNMFYACSDPQRVEGGAIKSYNDSISGVIWKKEKPGTIVKNKTDYVENECQFEARNIKYDKFDMDPALSYIPTSDYILEEDFTKLRKMIKSQAGVQDREPKSADELSASEYSMMPSGTTVNQITLPYDEAPTPGTNKIFAFSVDQKFDLEVGYSSGTGVLVNEAGENLLKGDGSVTKLPKGTYWIQSVDFTVADAATGTPAAFKNITISKLKITPNNSVEHDHNWVLDTQNSKDATCTETGQKVYKCSCNETKKETVAALGHAYSDWNVTKPATATEAGLKESTCSRCGEKQTEVIPATGGSSGGTGVVAPAGDYVLTFKDKKPTGATEFFTLNEDASFVNGKDPVIVSGEEYTDYLKMESSTQVKFSCNDGSTLFMAFGTAGKTVKIDGISYTTDSNGVIEIKLSAGEHILKKGTTDTFLYYISVSNPAPTVNKYKLKFEYNYDNSPTAKEIEVDEGTTYNSMSDLVPASFTRSGYTLKSLYTDANCTNAVGYPYAVNGNATFYAVWDEIKEDTYLLIFNTNGGSAVASVEVSKSQVYQITQKATKGGYAFAGWYDAAQGGNPVTSVDGSNLTGNYTVYAHWKFNISFDVGKGTAPSGLEDTTADAEDIIEIGDCTPPEGYIFKGWSVNGGNSIFKNEYTVKEGDASDGRITIVAVYEAIKYTVKYDANGGTLPSDMKETVEATIEDILTLGTCIPPKKKKFLGWSIGGSDTLINDSYTVKVADADNDKIITIKAMYGASEGGSGHEGISIIGLEESYEYTGAKIVPAIGVVDYDIGDDGKILTPGADYTVKYKDNKNVGTAKVMVTGKGNYAGKDTEKTFEIKAVDAKKAGLIDEGTELVDLKGARIAKINSVEYTGEEQHPDFTLTLKGKDAVTYTYNNGSYEIKAEQSDAGTPLAANVAVSNNINKGTATILITGKVPDGKTKATSVKKTFKITAVDLAKNESKVNVTATAGTYSVKGAAPGSLKVTYDGKELRKGIDYTVKYTGNKKATSSAQVVITGKGNYAKKVTGTTYEIKPLDMSGLEVKAINAYKDIKAGKVKATVLDGNGNTLKPSQYTLKVYSDNDTTKAYDSADKLPEGKIYVEAAAKDTVNLSGQTSRAEFNVAQNNIAKAKIKLNKDAKTNKTITKTYDGDEQTLNAADLTVTIAGNPTPLNMETDFVIAGYSNNVNKGTATAIIKGIGSYSGTKTVKFKIVGKNMAIEGDDGITWDDVTDVITSFMKKLVK